MALTKDWKDFPDTTTPLNAAALEDLESRAQGVIDTKAALLSSSQSLPTAFNPSALDTPVQNTTGVAILLFVRAGVLSDPGENGHIYLETCATSNGTYSTWCYVACRNQSSNTDAVGNGTTLWCVVPNNYYWRLRTATIAGYSTPTFVIDNPNGGCYLPAPGFV